MKQLELSTIEDLSEFRALGERAWDDLVLAQPRPSPFMLHRWLDAWIDHYSHTGRVGVHVAYREGRLVAALPLIRRRSTGLEIATFLGGTQSALADLMLAKGEPLDTARAVADRAAGDGHDLADLFGLTASSWLAQALGGDDLQLIERVEAPVLELTRGWETVYSEKTSSKKRNLHRRRRRQLAEQGAALSVEVARNPEELAVALEDAFHLHQLRWAGRPDGSMFATPRGKSFHRTALRALAPSGALRIVTLKLDGRPIAFHYFFLLAETMYVHRLAFDPAFARFSPGIVNTLDAIEAAAADGAKRVEFLGGDERYKIELADRLEPLHQGLGLVRTFRGRAVVRARLAAIHARRRLKRSKTLRHVYFDGLAPLRRSVGRMRAAATASD